MGEGGEGGRGIGARWRRSGKGGTDRPRSREVELGCSGRERRSAKRKGIPQENERGNGNKRATRRLPLACDELEIAGVVVVVVIGVARSLARSLRSAARPRVLRVIGRAGRNYYYYKGR